MRRVIALAVLAATIGPAAAIAPAQAAPTISASPCPQAPHAGVPLPRLAPRDPLIAQLGLDHAWPLSTGAGVTVGVVDTGVDPRSPKLAGAVDRGESLTAVDTPAVYRVSPGGTTDCDGHGTAVAAIVAGRVAAGDDRAAGVAPSARIYPVAVQGDFAQAPAALVGQAIREAADHASVINLSFARPSNDPDVAAAIKYALARNVVVVAAAGNEGAAQTQTWYPAAYPGVLAVAAVGPSGQPLDASNKGAWISVAAPGQTLTAVPAGGRGYVTVSGTSFAAAIVSGTAALIRSRFPSLTAQQVVARIVATAVPPGDGPRDDQVGAGVVDPFAALTAELGPAAGGQSAGSVPIVPSRRSGHGKNSTAVDAWAGGIVAAAVLAALGAISVRVGARRRWTPGRLAGPDAPAREIAPHAGELGD